jgi:NAD(P)-dependent dehydrogenase (short-subunit alcohol dehydrogenase family)
MTSSMLSGKVAIITGGGRGVGKATAAAFSELGVNVFVAARTTEQVERVAQELSGAKGEVVPFTADVGLQHDVDRLFEAVVARYGRVDIMLNNAGSFPIGPISEFPEEEFDAAVRIDVKAAYMCSKAALTTGGMLERGDGQIVNIGSVSVRRQIPNMAIHCALKAALLALSESLRREVAHRGVRVSLLCPSTINTELVQSDDARHYVHGEDKWLRPEDVADLITYVVTRPRGVVISEAAIIGV